jgi:hypothetical protein
MICFKDMTFCDGNGGKCKKFGEGCHRSLTEEVEEAAEKWWNPEGKTEKKNCAPICRYSDPTKIDCYEPK